MRLKELPIRHCRVRLLLALVPFGLLLHATALPADGAEGGAAVIGWSQFRGPDRSGISPETGLLRSWPAEGPRVVWQRTIGEGMSGMSVAEDTLYTLFAESDGEFLAAFKVEDGKEVWRLRMGDVFRDQFGAGPRSTPTIDDGVVYALGGKGRLVAATAASGELVWDVNLPEKYGFYGPQVTATGVSAGALQEPMFGYATSPLVEGDFIVFEAGTGDGKTYVALDKKTGDFRWSALDEPGITYSSPMAVSLAGQRQIVVLTTSEIVGLLTNGEVLWRQSWSLTTAQPVFVPPRQIFVSTSDHAGNLSHPGAMLIEVKVDDGKATAERVWHDERTMRNVSAASVYYNGYIYGFDNATLRCIVADTGESRWAKRGLGSGSLIIADGLLFLWSDQGKLTLAEATPEGFQQLGQVKVFNDGRTWTPPALAAGRLYLRGQTDVISLDVQGGE